MMTSSISNGNQDMRAALLEACRLARFAREAQDLSWSNRIDALQAMALRAPAVDSGNAFEEWCLKYYGKSPVEVRFKGPTPLIVGDLVAAFNAGRESVSRPGEKA